MAVIARRGSTTTSTTPSRKIIKRRFTPRERKAVEQVQATPRAEETLSRIFARDEVTISIIVGPDGPKPTAGTGRRLHPFAVDTVCETARTGDGQPRACSVDVDDKDIVIIYKVEIDIDIDTDILFILILFYPRIHTPNLHHPSPATGAGGTQTDVLPTQGGRVAAIGIAAGIFAGVAFIVLTAAFIYRYRKRKSAAASSS
ncbi:hypothetical protein CP532_6097 [Ophiocordyceps camponoti-leonardi (nom. inval.)]|nr:hypothetical protein CP532_6097 [Ophiocordyceps camponoti-leonardi (nom. inval.)]